MDGAIVGQPAVSDSCGCLKEAADYYTALPWLHGVHKGMDANNLAR